MIAAALVGAILWNLLTWRLGIPSSSSHALIGGLLGASLISAGISLVEHRGHRDQGAAAARRLADRRLHGRAAVHGAASSTCSDGRNPATAERGLPAAAGRVGGVHGVQPRQQRRPEDDGHHDPGARQRRRASTTFEVPLWVILTAATAISLGTAAGGWRIIKTMGQKVVKLDPVHGFAAETTAATVIFGASQLGMPVSTTHVISSAIMGVGSSDRLKTVRWGVAR